MALIAFRIDDKAKAELEAMAADQGVSLTELVYDWLPSRFSKNKDFRARRGTHPRYARTKLSEFLPEVKGKHLAPAKVEAALTTLLGVE